MPSTAREAHRSTQRVPLSCTLCASRKIKCSKDIPCRACLIRGTAADCKREVVLVRGRIRTADVPGSSPSVAELLLENARLSRLVAQLSDTESCIAPALDLSEYYETRLHVAVDQDHQPRVVASILDIALPTHRCSQISLDFADMWTSWVHFGCYFPDFRKDHDQFWTQGGIFPTADPMWLSLCFAVLASALVFMSDDDFARCEAPLDSRSQLTRNWYNAALFYMDQSDFLQKSHMRVVQAIVVLGNVASTIGETHRHSTLWAVAVRVAQQLNLGCDKLNLGEDLVQQQARRRLWWTLVICEWLPIPFRTPFIDDVDFSCQLPLEISDAGLAIAGAGGRSATDQDPCPVQYHIVMAKIATIYYHLHSKLRLRRWSPTSVADFVVQADNQLANEIEHLPHHLQRNDDRVSEDQQEIEQRLPWIAIQRTSLVMVLLYYRLAINRVLQVYWLEGSTNFARARSICLSSAVGVIISATSDQEHFSRLRSWDFAMLIFSAAVTLTLEVRRTEDSDPQLIGAIETSVRTLGQVRTHNRLAEEACRILNELRLGRPTSSHHWN